jgi:LmbE family N-acetylglucosaminyl deacetylase
MIKRLVISPHIDDEILGCGGILNEESFVLHCGIEDRTTIPAEQRIEEIVNAQQYLGFQMKLLRKNVVNHYKVADLIPDFEKAINELCPQEVYLPHPSYNQDHIAVYQAALVALRPHDINHYVEKVLIYEQPHVFLWDHTHDIDGSFKPNYFVEIDIDRKIKAYEMLTSQVRPFRDGETLEKMAFLRGKQSNRHYAEAYKIVRWVV